MATSQQISRIQNEIKMLQNDPPPGISCWLKDDEYSQLEANVLGPMQTPYENGVFKLEIKIPNKYPFAPPIIQFITPIYHPNIDHTGRICLDLLKMPPQGGWKPSLNLMSILKSIQLLMSLPNPHDPLRADVVSIGN
uniref:Ubiquitin-conjugating enzyme E2 T n=1 Tax=Strigamia maritima TaxID=126957 RepID=T1IND6_STRMM